MDVAISSEDGQARPRLVVADPAPALMQDAFALWLQRTLLGSRRRTTLSVALPLLTCAAGIALDGGFTPPIQSAYLMRAVLGPLLVVWMLLRLRAVGRRATSAATAVAAMRRDTTRIAVRSWPSAALWAPACGLALGLLSVQPWTNLDPGIRMGAVGGWVASLVVAAFFTLLAVVTWNALRVKSFLRAELRAELDVNPFDMSGFQAVARWALSVTITVLGIITLLLALYPKPMFRFPGYLVIPLLIAGGAATFAGTLWRTHRCMTDARAAELGTVRARVTEAYAALKQSADSPADSAASLRAWLDCERRLETVATWPYTIQTLRALTASVIVPLAVALIQTRL